MPTLPITFKRIEKGYHQVFRGEEFWGELYQERYKGTGPHGYKTACGVQWVWDIPERAHTEGLLSYYHAFALLAEAQGFIERELS